MNLGGVASCENTTRLSFSFKASDSLQEFPSGPWLRKKAIVFGTLEVQARLLYPEVKRAYIELAVPWLASSGLATFLLQARSHAGSFQHKVPWLSQ